MGDMSIHGAIGHELFREERTRILEGSSLVVVDGNLSEDNVHYLLKMCAEGEKRFDRSCAKCEEKCTYRRNERARVL